jgi:DNA-binding transcriptional LysR family regulator
MAASIVRHLSLRHLRLLVAIYDAQNLIGAGRELNLSQPAVTKSLQDAEELVGEQIFTRTNRGVIPTIYGEVLVAHARLIMAQLEHAADELADLRDGRGGHVSIGTLLSASVEILPNAIRLLRAERPKLQVIVQEGSNDRLLPRLRAGEIDLVVGRLSEFRQRDGLSQERLFDDIACVVARPGHPLKDVDNLVDLAGADWILPMPDTTLRRQVDSSFRAAGLSPPANAVVSVSHLTNEHLVEEGGYLAVWPQGLAMHEAAAGRVVVLPIPMPATRRAFGITIRSDTRLSPAALATITTIRRVALHAAAAAAQSHEQRSKPGAS